MWKFWKRRAYRIERIGCKSKQEIFEHLAYMVNHAPDFPAEDKMDLDLAFDCLEFGLKRIEELDGRPAVVAMISKLRAEFANSRSLFQAGEITPARHSLQDAEDMLRPVRVKAVVA
ncbi:hypothetical protein [Lysobacter sp. P5_B9]